MGKLLLRLAALIALLVAVILVIGSLLPRGYDFEVVAEIESSPAQVFPMINTLPNWELWSTFSKQRVEGLEIEYGGTRSGEGAVQKWRDSRDEGKMWITAAESEKYIEYNLKFGQFPTMESRIELQGEGNKTRVTWSSRGELPPGPFYGYFALLFPGQMQHEYAQSLERLNELVK